MVNRNNYGDPICYADGACSDNGTEYARAGIGVFWGDNHPDNVSRRLRGPQTNNQAEITAALVACSIANRRNYDTLEVRTDSKLVVNAMNNWIHNWKSNGWRGSNGREVRNQDAWMRLDNAVQRLDRVKFTHVPGHSGNYGNEQANNLAMQGCKKNF